MEPAEVRRFINPLSRLPNRMEEKVAHNRPLLRRVTDPFSNRPVVDNFQEAPAAPRLSGTGFHPQIWRKRQKTKTAEIIAVVFTAEANPLGANVTCEQMSSRTEQSATVQRQLIPNDLSEEHSAGSRIFISLPNVRAMARRLEALI